MKKIKRKSLLYRSGVEYADFCINHVEGCAHNCNYPCYARQMARRFGRKDSEWTKPKLVENALELLDKEIPKYKGEIEFVHLCFMTDPFMHKFKEVEDMTLRIIEKLNKNGIRCSTLTKGIYPKGLTENKYNRLNEYGITLVSLDEEFKRKYEADSAEFLGRIKALKYLHDNGLRTWISMEPYPPPKLAKQNLRKILEKIKFADTIIFGKLNYNVVSSMHGENKIFYEKCANEVIEFCKSNNIDYHIKFGTQRKPNIKTSNLFKGIKPLQ